MTDRTQEYLDIQTALARKYKDALKVAAARFESMYTSDPLFLSECLSALADADGWTGRPCRGCNGTGEDNESRSCPACDGTGEENISVKRTEI
jgi:RecJ-like exonuclease